MKLLIATHNQAKLKRYKDLLSDFDNLEFVSLSDLAITEKSAEPFATAEENAIFKAQFYQQLSGLATLSIDESVTTNFLPAGEQPSVYVRRWRGGRELNDDELLEVWREIIETNSVEPKLFDWLYHIAYVTADGGMSDSFEVEQHNKVAWPFSEKRIPGYPMSSFMVHMCKEKPNSELTEEEKIQVDRNNFKNFLEFAKKWFE